MTITEKPPLPAGPHHGRQLAVGSVQGFIGSAVSLPTGLITAAFLTRSLGAEAYGLFTVSATLIGLIELSITTGFSRSAEKFVTETENWRPVATRFVQAQLGIGLAAAVILVLLAPLLAAGLNHPDLAFFLRIYAVGIPITAMGSIHQSILIGRGGFGRRALLLGAYWMIRLVLMLLLVHQSRTVTAAIFANIGSALLTLVMARRFIRPSLLRPSDFPVRKLWSFAWPLFFYTVCLSLFRQVDLFLVTALCQDTAWAGYYGATKNLTIIPGLVAMSLSPLLLAKLSELLSRGERQAARRMVDASQRAILGLFPFAALAAETASQIASLIYGPLFAPAGPILAVLIFGAVAFSMIMLSVSIFITADRPAIPLLLIAPALPLAAVCHYFAILRFEAVGAAVVTTVFAVAVALTAGFISKKIWLAGPTASAWAKIIAITALTYGLSAQWPASGPVLIGKLFIGSIGISLVLAACGLLPGELRALKSFVFPANADTAGKKGAR